MTPANRTDAVLVVEDNPDDLHFLLRAFRKSGASVPLRIARTGQEALDYLEGRSEDDKLLAVLLDLKLPVRSGFEVLDYIKQHTRLRATPVVILTSSAESQDLKLAYELGANSYLVKPAEVEALTALVSSIELYWLRQNRVS